MSLRENLHNKPVSSLSLREAILFGPASKVRDAVGAMREKRLGCVIVTDADDRPLGMFTEGILKRMMLDEPAELDEPLEQHMATKFPCVKNSDPIAIVVSAMVEKNERFVCVVDENGRTVGLTGQKGLMEYIAEHYPGEVMVQRVGSEPYVHEREGA